MRWIEHAEAHKEVVDALLRSSTDMNLMTLAAANLEARAALLIQTDLVAGTHLHGVDLDFDIIENVAQKDKRDHLLALLHRAVIEHAVPNSVFDQVVGLNRSHVLIQLRLQC